MDNLIQLYKEKQKELSDLYHQLLEYNDGYFYLVVIRRYGSVTTQIHKNEFTVEEECSGYNGDNGIVDIYTNNKNYSSYYWKIFIMSEDEIKEKYNIQ